MDLTKLNGYDSAHKALLANCSPRMRHLDSLESYVAGTQYAGRPDWFSSDKPLWERAPCIVYPIVRSGIDSNTDLVLGNGRFPGITTHPDEDDAEFDTSGLDEKDSKVIDRFIVEMARQTRLRSSLREVFSAAQGSSSGLLMFGVRSGKLFADTTKAKWCTPSFDNDGKVSALEIKYPYLEQFQDGQGVWTVRSKLYRRRIDTLTDVTFLPADANPRGIEPNWVADPNQVFQHGFGFCPVVWYPFMRGCSVINDFDGHALHEHVTDEVRGLDFALSQRHRAALYAGDPQWTEIGVSPGTNPSGRGTRADMPASPGGGDASSGNPITGRYVEPSRLRKGRKKSPGDVWQYSDPDVKVHLHTLPGDALTSLDEHASDLRMKIAESMAVVFTDMQGMKLMGVMSGKAVELLKARQLDRCDQYRDDVGDHLIVPSVEMMMRITKVACDKGMKIRIAGLDKALAILKKFDIADVVSDVAGGPYR